MLRIEHVIVGNESKSTPKEKKSETLVGPMQSYQHESLQCFLCFITFSNAKAKERHMKKSHRELYKLQLQETDTLFSCYQCGKSFSSSELLSQHQASHNKEEKPFRCTHCQKNFPTYAEVNIHRRQDCIEQRFSCGECGAQFQSTSKLHRHRITEHLQGSTVVDDVYTHQCTKCRRAFQTEEVLLKHQEMYAHRLKCGPLVKKRGRRPKNATDRGTVESKRIKLEEKSYIDSPTEGCLSSELQTELEIPCPEADCDLTFPSVTALRVHKRAEHGPAAHKLHSCTE